MTWLGIDIGTSGVKTILMDRDQVVVTTATAPLDVQRPHPGWSEQDPDQWWDAVLATLDEISANNASGMATVQGIGLSGHMHGATLIDADDQVLRPCILWNDGRSAEQCEVLEAAADFRGIGGNIVMPGFTAPKLEWVRTHEPEIFSKTAKVLLPKDYVRLRLTGEYISDMSDSAGTLWMDVAQRDWSKDLLAATHLSSDHMPALVEGSAQGGRLRPALAQRFGMTSPPVVAGGGGDNAASACGVGAIAAGSGFLSLGTSGVLFVCNDAFSPNTARAVHAFCHATPQTWHQMGVILSATDALNWLSGITGQSPEDLAIMAANADPGSDVMFLPYLSGERTPHNNANARGSFSGLSHLTTTADLARAVLEGVAYAFADCAEALQAAGTRPETVLAIGGGSKSGTWLQIIADATGLVLQIPAKGDFGAAFGAARLAICASENADPHQVITPPDILSEVQPDPPSQAKATDKYARYKDLYPALH